MFMIRSMDMAESDLNERESRDPDLHWTGWALESLREMVAIDMRTKRVAAQQQGMAGPDGRDFALMQSRLSRSVRLAIAMTERIRADYLHRKAEAEESGQQERRRQRRAQAVRDTVAAAALPDDAEDAERVRAEAWERLTEDEVLDARIDTLSPEDFVREVCRRIGRPPDPIPLPQGWDDGLEAGPEAGANDNAGSPGGGVERAAAAAGDGRAGSPEEEGCPPSRPSVPDSS
jgi:hypothetical protein